MGKHTSRVNAAKYRDAPDTLVQRILAKREVSPEGCWLWTSYVNPDGYAVTRYWTPGNQWHPEVMVHRLIYMRLVGDIADDAQVDHKCHDPAVCKARQKDCLHRRCYNPEHLEAVTGAVNLLRSGNFTAVNAAKTHCDQRHEFTPRNTRIAPDGSRRCRACLRQHAANERAARRTSPPPVRACRRCGADIAHLNGRIWYCEVCEPLGRQAVREKGWAEKRTAARVCLDCGTDISACHLNAVRCEACSPRRRR